MNQLISVYPLLVTFVFFLGFDSFQFIVVFALLIWVNVSVSDVSMKTKTEKQIIAQLKTNSCVTDR